VDEKERQIVYQKRLRCSTLLFRCCAVLLYQ
jgi:hypothetical protein